MKIPVKGLISLFRQMFDEHWAYVWGAARKGCVDCSGAFVYAYRQYNKSIYHGSNAIARQYVVELLPISKAKPGMAAFKLHKPGEKNYSLPAQYQKGGRAYNGDLCDYYHVGLVDDKGVLNAQSTQAGFTRTALSKWHCVGYLKAVDYEGDEPKMETYIVTADNGLPVRVRDNPGGATITRLKCGTRVEAGEVDSAGWREIRFDGQTGYMMAKFLVKEEEAGVVKTLTQKEYNDLCEARDTLIRIVGVG